MGEAWTVGVSLPTCGFCLHGPASECKNYFMDKRTFLKTLLGGAAAASSVAVAKPEPATHRIWCAYDPSIDLLEPPLWRYYEEPVRTFPKNAGCTMRFTS